MSTNKNKTILSVLLLSYISVYSQSQQNSGWLFISHTQQLTKRFDALADVQVRSGDRLAQFKTLLLRGGVRYNFNKKHSVATGYTYKGDWTYEESKRSYSPENRIFEQYLLNTKISRNEFTFQYRQEQRFVKDMGKNQFSQRSRAFVSFQFPLVANVDFSKGLYTTLQDEIFLNTQHKERVNNSLFDQNRPFVSVGYRWSKKLDTEIGYMYWLKRETEGDVQTSVFQVMITTQL